MDAKLAAYTARKIVETFARDPNLSPDLSRVLQQLLGSDLSTFQHLKVNARITISINGEETFEGGPDTDLVSVNDANGKRRILILV